MAGLFWNAFHLVGFKHWYRVNKLWIGSIVAILTLPRCYDLATIHCFMRLGGQLVARHCWCIEVQERWLSRFSSVQTLVHFNLVRSRRLVPASPWCRVLEANKVGPRRKVSAVTLQSLIVRENSDKLNGGRKNGRHGRHIPRHTCACSRILHFERFQSERRIVISSKDWCEFVGAIIRCCTVNCHLPCVLYLSTFPPQGLDLHYFETRRSGPPPKKNECIGSWKMRHLNYSQQMETYHSIIGQAVIQRAHKSVVVVKVPNNLNKHVWI